MREKATGFSIYCVERVNERAENAEWERCKSMIEGTHVAVILPIL